MAGLNDASSIIQILAVPAVCILVAFLGYFSQYLFQYSSLEPGPPSRKECIFFNILLLSLWYTYFKTVTEDPGRYVFPDHVIEVDANWCKKCSAPKPARAHHCKHCGRCIPKMDHHCPWTANCVSMSTFPHFLRFLVFANFSLWALARLLWQRFYVLWESRHMPAYLGPTLPALIGLAVVSLITLVTILALAIMLITTIKSWLFNCTMIEGWQIERHEAVIDRGGRDWWDIEGPNGKKIRIEKVEFPYDLGIWANMSQAMGTSNVLLWLFPLSGSPKVGENGTGCGWEWAENGFNYEEGLWPPLDPEKLRRATREIKGTYRDFEAELRDAELSSDEWKRTFKQRQAQDISRRRKLWAELEEEDDYELSDDHVDVDFPDEIEDWTNPDGETLEDYGVEDDEIPIGRLIRRRTTLRTNVLD